jgi:hypothetical protein
MLAGLFALPVTLMVACKSGVPATSGAAKHSGGTGWRPPGPCDIYAAGGTPCVAAHSTTRALYAGYSGPLYQVVRQSDGQTLDIGVVKPSAIDAGGYADAAAQDAFCDHTICLIKVIYDQSGKGNDLLQAPPGTFKGPAKGGFDALPIADMAPITIGGHKAYGVFIMPGMGFRNNNAAGVAINDEPEGIYYVIDGTHYDSGCCFDYGNASANGHAVGTGTMETVYFGTATAWGSGDGPGPWIMADMEAGLFSGYSAKKNAADPTIGSWRFVTAVMDGGGGNRWDLRGGNAQQGALTTFYSGIRPGSSNGAAYFPMHKKGGILLGNGGDNGNGSSGTFYEGVITTGYPTEATSDALQANVVAAKYDLPQVTLSRVTSFAPGAAQNATVTFRNSTGATVTGAKLSLAVPSGWRAAVAGTAEATQTIPGPVAPGMVVSGNFQVTAPTSDDAGYLGGKVEWKNSATGKTQSDESLQRVRSAVPVKINEVRFGDSFIELFNASSHEVDISGWSLVHTPSQCPAFKLATMPPGTKLPGHGFYLLGLAGSGLAAPVSPGASAVNVRSTNGLEPGQKIQIDGETRSIINVGTPASAVTPVFIPVSAGPWLTIPAGSTNLPVASAGGFEVGQKIGIDVGGNYEVGVVTYVGKAGTQTTLATAAAAGATSIKLVVNSDLSVGDTLMIGTGQRTERATVKAIVSVSAASAGGRSQTTEGGGGEVELASPLKMDHMAGVDVSGSGTGISFSPATKFAHVSGDAVQALGAGVMLDRPLAGSHEYGAAIVNGAATSGSYQGPPAPDQWFGIPLVTAGSLALLDAGGKVVVDALVFGSRQSSSSANGTITSPELATLEGDQGQGGCIVVAPTTGRGSFGRGASPAGATNRSVGRFPDGADSDNNCSDYQLQAPTPRAANQLSQ